MKQAPASIFPLEYPNTGKPKPTYMTDFHMLLLGLIPRHSEVQFIFICKLTAIMQITSGYDLHSLSLMMLKNQAGYEC